MIARDRYGWFVFTAPCPCGARAGERCRHILGAATRQPDWTHEGRDPWPPANPGFLREQAA